MFDSFPNASNEVVVETSIPDGEKVTSSDGHFICDLCGKTLKTEKSLRCHNRIVHGKGKPPQFCCDICDKRYFSSIKLTAHINKVHIKLPLCKCKKCGKSFTDLDCVPQTRHNCIDKKSCSDCYNGNNYAPFGYRVWCGHTASIPAALHRLVWPQHGLSIHPHRGN